MEPPGHRPGLPSQAWLLWLTDPLQDLEPQVRAVLFRELLATPGLVLVGMLSGLLLSAVGLTLHFTPSSAALAVLQVVVPGSHAAAVAKIARDAPPGGGAPTGFSVASSIALCGVQGAVACAYMLGDQPQVKVLAAAMIFAMAGPLCAVNYPAPRLAMLLVVLCVGPLAAGGCLSGERGLLALAVTTPPFLQVAWQMILVNQKLAVGALNAEFDSARRARQDPLTGLGNRLGFAEALPPPGPGARGDASGDWAMLCLDLDGFKAVNDTLGHHAGDLLLQAVARRLEAVLRPGYRVFRLGGDEFTVLVEGLPAASVGALAERVIAAVGAEPFRLEGIGEARVGVSVGYACAPEDGAELAELHRKADAALYASKAAGKGVHRRTTDREGADGQAAACAA